MNQKLVIGVVAFVVIVAGVGIYSSNNSKLEMLDKDAMLQKESSTMNQGEGSMMEQDSWTPEQMEAMKKDAMMNKGDTMVKDPMKAADEKMIAKPGSYEAFSTAKVAMASDTNHVVLFFRASWCPSCKTVDKDIKARLKDIPSNLTILDVDYDNSTELKKKYGVTYQHTFVEVDKDGKLIKKWSGSSTLASLVSEVK